MSNTEIHLLQEMIESAHDIVGFTGAGISTECGIPDFRSPNGLWSRYKPIDFSEFMASEEARVEAWRRKLAIDEAVGEVSPGRGHKALARLIAQGRMSAIITQNIDGLHQKSGVPDEKIIELHGNGTYAACLDCKSTYSLAWAQEQLDTTQKCPDCVYCNGYVKSATISFGQKMPEREMRLAEKASEQCDLCLVIGSSLVVRPAADLPFLAKQRGAKLIIVNNDVTPLDIHADLIIREDIGEVLSQVVLTTK